MKEVSNYIRKQLKVTHIWPRKKKDKFEKANTK
jgi:hypothetical protein